MAQGRRPAWIIERACRRFNVSVPTIERDLHDIRARWGTEADTTRADVRAELSAQIDHALAKAYARGDGKGIPALLRLKAQFHGHLRLDEAAPSDKLTDEERELLHTYLAERPAVG